MNSYSPRRISIQQLLWIFLCVGLMFSPSGKAGNLSLATAPLANATTTQVLPNIMFTLDDSGSMAWDFMPDWVGDDYPRSSNTSLYKNAGFNVAYYNPAITYTPPVMYNDDGTLNTTTYPSKTSGWDSVKYDAFGKQGNDVAVNYPNQLCPNGNTPSGTSPNQTCNLVGGADYFTFVAGEYCKKIDLKTCIPAVSRVWCKNPDFTDCQATETTEYKYTEYPFAGNLRWCSDLALTTCQVTKTSTYQYPRYPGVPQKSKLTVSGSGTSRFTSVKVDGKEIMFSQTNSLSSSNDLARDIRDRINDCTLAKVGNCEVLGYSATRVDNVVTVTAPSGSTITSTPTWTESGTGSKIITATAFSGSVPGSVVYTNIVSTNQQLPLSWNGNQACQPNRLHNGYDLHLQRGDDQLRELVHLLPYPHADDEIRCEPFVQDN